MWLNSQKQLVKAHVEDHWLRRASTRDFTVFIWTFSEKNQAVFPRMGGFHPSHEYLSDQARVF